MKLACVQKRELCTGWSRAGPVNLAYETGLLQSRDADGTVRHLMTLNKVHRKSHWMTDLRLRFPPVKTEELQWMVCQDAGWCNGPTTFPNRERF